jgi:hypothetical protein
VHRPDLIQTPPNASSIPSELPDKYNKSFFALTPDLPVRTLLRSIKRVTADTDLTGWLMMRVPKNARYYWNGLKACLAENGTPLPLPEHIVCQLPQFPLEFYVKKIEGKSDQLLIADLPCHHQLKLSERLAFLDKNIRVSSDLAVVHYSTCKGRDHLNSLLKASSDEEILLVKPNTFYYDEDSVVSCAPSSQVEMVVSDICPFVVALGKPK